MTLAEQEEAREEQLVQNMLAHTAMARRLYGEQGPYAERHEKSQTAGGRVGNKRPATPSPRAPQ